MAKGTMKKGRKRSETLEGENENVNEKNKNVDVLERNGAKLASREKLADSARNGDASAKERSKLLQ